MDAAADVIARLEGAVGTVLFCSGCSAISNCLLTFAKAGDHMVNRLACQFYSIHARYSR